MWDYVPVRTSIHAKCQKSVTQVPRVHDAIISSLSGVVGGKMCPRKNQFNYLLLPFR